MCRGDAVTPVEVCDRPGHLEDAVVRAGRQAQSVQGSSEESSHLRGGATVSAQVRRAHLAVGEDPCRVAESFDLSVAGSGDALAHGGGPLPRPIPGELPKRNRRDLYVEVDPVQERTRHLRPITLYVHRIASAPPRVVSVPTTRTRVHRSGQHESRRVSGGRTGSRMGHHPILQRLTQRLEYMPAVLGELVQEQDSLVRQADLTGPRDRPSSHQPGVTHRVMRSPKGPPHQQ